MKYLRINMQSLLTRMTVFFGLVVLAGCVALWLVSTNRADEAIKAEAEEGMLKVVKQYTAMQDNHIATLKYIVENVAARDVVRGQAGGRETTLQEKLAVLAAELQQAEKLGFKRMGLIDKSGKAFYPDGRTADLGDRDYFKEALTGKTYISSTLVSKVDNSVMFAVAAPVRHYATGEITGVVFGIIDSARFAKEIGSLSYAQTGYAFAVDSTGKMIGHKDQELVLKQVNFIEEAKKNPELAELAAIISRMANGEEGLGVYTYQGQKKYVAFAPVKSTGWSVAINAPVDEVLDKAAGLNRALLVVSALVLVIALTLTVFIARSIAIPIKQAVDHLGTIADGDFTQVVADKFFRRTDEIGQLTRALDKLQRDLRPLIGGIRSDAKTLSTSSESLSAASQEVASSSSEVARAIQEVASGASDQATSLQDIITLIGDITSQLEKVYTELGRVKANSEETSALAGKGKQELDLLTASIDNVKQAFQLVAEKLASLDKSVGQIGEIMGVITGIADQTNLLALNAAIEAARAGEAGRGFAVVAEEVRKLAEQSRASADQIKQLLDTIGTETGEVVATAKVTQDQVTNQIENVKNTVRSFDDILASVAAIAPMIAAAYQEMDKTIKAKDAVLDRVQSVSAVSEETSAASEEIAASAEELTASTQEIAAGAQQVLEVAKRLDEQVERFKV